MTAACAFGLGTVKPWGRPPWFTAVPRITPRMRSPSATASARGRSSTAPTPSPGTKPSPPSPKLRHRPSLDANRPWPSIRYLLGCTDTLTPPATAAAHSPRRIAAQARWMAVSAEAHIVSTATLGPLASKKYDTWLATDARLPGTTTFSPRAMLSAP
ncbi:hypothetical protein GCM10010145_44550 [Streptomyces ruber]|uniref:Uncharacterized protein n=1 Tax=Streptomyces ruber TaxID=83378 RepID=A0A918BJ73_9ACTN|nr:hypothetical protein GCM10010145_44550 [Streptomyces ruber]